MPKQTKHIKKINHTTELSPSKQQLGFVTPRTPQGRFVAGFSGNPGADAGRARRALNIATIQGFADAYRRGGQKAIDLVMKNNPAMFIKMLVLLVPRELEVSHSQGVKGMTDEQLERALEAIEQLIRERDAKLINATPLPDVVPERVPSPSD